MKIEQRSAGSYRVRKMYKGKTYTLVFNEKPTQKQITTELAKRYEQDVYAKTKGTFRSYAKKYIEHRSNVVSPSTILTYTNRINVMSDDFLDKELYDITADDIQAEVNRYAEKHTPKTVRNMYGLITAIFKEYRPSFALSTKLPQKIKQKQILPKSEEIRAILDAAKGTEDSIGFQLGVLGLRVGEICSLSLEDLNGNELHIHRNMVYNHQWIIKDSPKTDASNRTIYIPESLAEEIRSKGYYFKYSPQKLNQHLHEYQSKLNIPQFRFHMLRHYFASYAHELGVSDQVIMALGGWETDYVMKDIYRDALEEAKEKSAMQIASSIFGN